MVIKFKNIKKSNMLIDVSRKSTNRLDARETLFKYKSLKAKIANYCTFDAIEDLPFHKSKS